MSRQRRRRGKKKTKVKDDGDDQNGCKKCCCFAWKVLKFPCVALSWCNRKFGDHVSSQKEIDASYRPSRWPTDPYCILLFVGFWMGMVIVATYGVERGNPRTLILPSDRLNNICGEINDEPKAGGGTRRRDLSDKPVLWYPFEVNVANPSNTRLMDALQMGICVEDCPTDSLVTSKIDIANFSSIFTIAENAIICEYDYQSLPFIAKVGRVRNGSGCFLNWLPTDTFNRRCIPDVSQSSTLSTTSKRTFQALFYTNILLKRMWYEIQACFLVYIFLVILMMIVCFMFLVCVQLFIKTFVYTVLYVLFFVLGFVAFYCAWIGIRKHTAAKTSGDSSQQRLAIVWMVIGGLFFVAEFLYLMLMIFMMNRIGIAIEIIIIAAKPIKKVPWMGCVPVITFFFAVGVTVYWIIIAAYIQSAKVPITYTGADLEKLTQYVKVNATDHPDGFVVVSNDKTIQGLQYYHLFGYIWTMFFVLAFGYTIIAGVVSNWYFSGRIKDTLMLNGTPTYFYSKKGAGYFPVMRSAGRVMVHHLGSVLFGSLLVAIVQMLRIVVHRIQKMVEKAGGKNKCTTALFNCIKCLLWILQKIIKFINKNAYIMMMIHGSCFGTSAIRAMVLILQNLLAIGMVNFIGDFMLFLAQIGLTIVGAVITYLFIQSANDVYWLNWLIFLAPKEANSDGRMLHRISYPIVPVTAGLMISFVVAGLFINLYQTSIDTILMCFCEDRKRNQGTESSPYYMPSELVEKVKVLGKMSVGKKK